MNKKLLWVLGIVGIIVIAGAGYLLGTRTPKQDLSSVSLTDRVFDASTLKVGDEVAGMTVTAIGPAREGSPINFSETEAAPVINYKVSFSGIKVLRGTYYYSEYVRAWIFTLDDESIAKLPADSRVGGTQYVCVNDALKILGEQGSATIEISSLTLAFYPSNDCWSVKVTEFLEYDAEPYLE